MIWTMTICENAALTIPGIDMSPMIYSWCKISLVSVLEICIDINLFYDYNLVLIKFEMTLILISLNLNLLNLKI